MTDPVFWFIQANLPKVAVAKFSGTLSTMINLGVPILGKLNIFSKAAGNVVV